MKPEENIERRWHAPTHVAIKTAPRCEQCGRAAQFTAVKCLRCDRLFCCDECVDASRCSPQGDLFAGNESQHG